MHNSIAPPMLIAEYLLYTLGSSNCMHAKKEIVYMGSLIGSLPAIYTYEHVVEVYETHIIVYVNISSCLATP